MTSERTIVATVFILVFALGALLAIDTDVWWHLRAGDEILSSGVIRRDSFSFTKAGADWIDHSWGSEVIMSLLWRSLGYAGLELMAGTWQGRSPSWAAGSSFACPLAASISAR